jgi:hypothetical protein
MMTMSNEGVEGQIVKQLRAEPSLSRTNIDARANDNSVVLTGNVDTMAQHDLALRIARANAGDLKIVDNINVQQHYCFGVLLFSPIASRATCGLGSWRILAALTVVNLLR